MSKEYTAEHIRVASDIEQIRDNIHLFAGEEGDSNPNHLLYEVLHNSIDEVANGYASNILVSIDTTSHEITVVDDGRGIPIDKKDGIYVPYVVTTRLASSGKGKSQSNKGYEKPTAGLHGYGLTIVNALSEKMTITSIRNHKAYTFSLKEGTPVSDEPTVISHKMKHGTIVSFIPSSKYIQDLTVDIQDLLTKASAIKFSLGSKLGSVRVIVDGKEQSIHDDYLNLLFKLPSKHFISTCSEKNFENICLYFAFDKNQLKNLALKGKTANFKYSGILNSIPVEEGTHIQYAVNALKQAFYEIAQKMKLTDLTKDDFTKGMRLLVNANILQKDFNSQDKTKLTTSQKYFKDRFPDLVEKIKKLLTQDSVFENLTKPYIEIIHSYKVSQGTKNLTKHSSKNGRIQRRLGIKNLQDCLLPERNGTTLFIVEGESAGGHLSRIRDINRHAVYYLTGKPMNVSNTPIQKVLQNKVVSELIQTIGIGYSYKTQTVNINSLRYEKVVILSDADPDGLHIRNLLLTLFATLMPELLLQGYVYISEQPLYKVYLDKAKKNFMYLYDFEELQNLKDKIVKFKRFKGLGEMEASDLNLTLFSEEHSRYVHVECTSQDIDALLEIMKKAS